jgi:hypothetical protein
MLRRQRTVRGIVDARVTTGASFNRRSALFSHVLRWAGVEERADCLIWPFPAMVETIGRLWIFVLLGVVFAIFTVSTIRFEYFSPTGLVEEAAYTYTSANNYLRFGVSNTLLLQDFSTSSDPADHPYAYNHMPPGPDLLTAGLLKITRGSYRATRLTLAILSLVGLGFFFRFAGLMLGRVGIRGGGLYAVMFLSPWLLFANLDRHNVAVAPLLAFAPLVSLHAHYETGRRRYLAVTMALAFLSSVYLEYVAMLAYVSSWILLYLTRLFRIERRHLFYVITAFAAGVAAHLLQNLAYLGPRVFLEELSMLLSNRISGHPTKHELQAFYQSIGLVHHGASPFQLSAFIAQLAAGLRFTARGVLVAITLVLAFCYVVRAQWLTADGLVLGPLTAVLRSPTANVLGRLLLWAVVAATLPLCFFPAYAQEVTLYGNGTNLYFLSISAAAVFLYALKIFAEDYGLLSTIRELNSRLMMRALNCVALAGLLFLVVYITAVTQANELRTIISETSTYRYRALGEIRDRFAGNVFMTNISGLTVGFLLKETGWAVCGLDAVPEQGDVNPLACHSANMRRREQYEGRRPRYFLFFWSADLFPGFSDCLPSDYFPGEERGGDTCIGQLYRRLSNRFEMVYENKLVKVFDLHSKKAAQLR